MEKASQETDLGEEERKAQANHNNKVLRFFFCYTRDMKKETAMEIYKGNIITSKSFEKLECKKGYIFVKDGIIEDIRESLPEGFEGTVTDYGDNIIIPAFSDLHMHAPQYVERGIGMDALLFDWLNNYTFPQESRFKDINYAKAIYPQLIRDLLRMGTMHISFFTTIHEEACDLLFELCKEAGLYAYLGITNMDSNSPDYYVDTTEESLHKTERFIQKHLGHERVKPILTPRFAPTCSAPLMKGLGDLAKKYDLGVQTHLVESIAEAAWSKELFPDCASDGEIYEKYGLLQGSGPKIFAHVIFPTEVEERILKEYDGISVHCPDATANVTAGIMPAKLMHEKGLPLAIGSDVGGGHYLGIYRQIATAVQFSKLKEFFEEGNKRLVFANAFHMATAEGGRAFGKVGKLEKGYAFNALVIGGLQDKGTTITPIEELERFCYIGDDRNILVRYLRGKKIDPEEIYRILLKYCEEN